MSINNKVNLFIIGVNKAGSSWLYYQLNAHPRIFMSEVKELYYFNNEYPDNIEKYHSNFPFDQDFKYFGEATPTYYRKHETAKNIKKYCPEAKIIAIVRDPISHLRSQFYFHKQLGIIPEKKTIEEVITEQDTRLLQDSHYEKTLPDYQEIFGGNFKIVSLEGATGYIELFWKEIQDFLNLKIIELPELSNKSENPTGSSLFRLLYRYTIRPVKKRAPGLYKNFLKMNTMRTSKKILLKLLGKANKDNIPKKLKKELQLEFKETYKYLHKLSFKDIYK
jgi:hypothetical protein